MSYTPHTVFASTGCPWPQATPEQKSGRMSQAQVLKYVLGNPGCTSMQVKSAMEAESDNCVRRMLLELQKAGHISKTYDPNCKTYKYCERNPDDPRTYRPRARLVRNTNPRSSGRPRSPGSAEVQC